MPFSARSCGPLPCIRPPVRPPARPTRPQPALSEVAENLAEGLKGTREDVARMIDPEIERKRADSAKAAWGGAAGAAAGAAAAAAGGSSAAPAPAAAGAQVRHWCRLARQLVGMTRALAQAWPTINDILAKPSQPTSCVFIPPGPCPPYSPAERPFLCFPASAQASLDSLSVEQLEAELARRRAAAAAQVPKELRADD